MKKILVACALTLVVVMAAMAGGAGESAEPSVVQMEVLNASAEPVRDGLIETIVTDFNALETGVRFSIETIDPDQYKTRLPVLMAGNEAPDVFFSWAAGFLKPYVEAGRVESLTPYLEADPEWAGRLLGGITDLVAYDGEVYAVPAQQTVAVLYYNEALFRQIGAEAPQTLDDLFSLVEAFSAEGITPISLGARDSWVSGMFMAMIANRLAGSGPYEAIAAGAGSWLDPSYVRAAEIMQELEDAGAFPDGVNAVSYDETLSRFRNGQAAMLFMGTWAAPAMVAEDSPIRDVVAVTTFPRIRGGSGSPNAWLGQPDSIFAVSSSADDVEGAVELLKRFSLPEYQRAFAEDVGGLIATNTALDPDNVLPIIQDTMELQASMDEMFIFYDVGLGPEVGNAYNASTQAILGGEDVIEVLSDLQAQTEAAF